MTESPTTAAEAIEAQLAGARLRVLIVGAGIAGATLAALLRRRGEPAATVERGQPDDAGGYMLGLLPLGGRVLHGLGLDEAFAAVSAPMTEYVMHDRRGRELRRFPLAPIVDRYGAWSGVTRGDLLGLLRGVAGPIRYGTTVDAIEQDDAGARVRLHDGSEVRVDLVVIADGIHSATRRLVLEPSEVVPFDTGWGGFVFWAPLEAAEAHTYRELWSDGWGVGLYPVPGRVGVFLAGRDRRIATRDPQAYADAIEHRDLPAPFARALAHRDRAEPVFYWKMADVRSSTWWRQRAVLLGDAAAAFLPTAGVGASAAMDSAAALADELSRAEPDRLSYALSLYERRQRHRVELAQKNSRDLARYMFVGSGPAALLRDQLLRFYTLDRLVKDISAVMDGA